MVKYIIPLLLITTTANANDFIDAQKDFTLGMYAATQNIAKQIWPESSVLGQYHQNNQQTAENAANDTDSFAYHAGVVTGVSLDTFVLIRGSKDLTSVVTEVSTKP